MSGSPMRKIRRACQSHHHVHARIKAIDGRRWCETCAMWIDPNERQPGPTDLNDPIPPSKEQS